MRENLMEVFQEAELPEGVVAYLPGIGEEIGPDLVRHPDVAMIAFTGSKGVGLLINREAADTLAGQDHVKRVLAEMGGSPDAVGHLRRALAIQPRFPEALNTLAELFPDREVIGIHSVDLVLGLGALHCLTHEQPAGPPIARSSDETAEVGI